MTLLEAFLYVSRVRWPFRFQMINKADCVCDFIDSRAGDLPIDDKLTLMLAPIPWRDQAALDIVEAFYRQYRNQMRVNLVECLRFGPLRHLEEGELSMKQGSHYSSYQTLSILEGLHKVLVVYMWMKMRMPVAWCDHEVDDLKVRTEQALDWALQAMSRRSSDSDQLPDILALRRRNENERIAYVDHQHMLKRKETRWDGRRAEGKKRAGS